LIRGRWRTAQTTFWANEFVRLLQLLMVTKVAEMATILTDEVAQPRKATQQQRCLMVTPVAEMATVVTDGVFAAANINWTWTT
jgi:hypothetical protein